MKSFRKGGNIISCVSQIFFERVERDGTRGLMSSVENANRDARMELPSGQPEVAAEESDDDAHREAAPPIPKLAGSSAARRRRAVFLDSAPTMATGEWDGKSTRHLLRGASSTSSAPGVKRKLPDFSGSQKYWDGRYEEWAELDKINARYEAYCSASDLSAPLKAAVPEGARVLELGCGASPMGPWIKEHTSARLVVCVDTSSVAVVGLQQRFSRLRPHVRFVKVDVRRLPKDLAKAVLVDVGEHGVQRESYTSWDVVVDKGAVDCLFSASNGVHVAQRVFRDVCDMLVEGGRFLFTTSLDPACRTPYLDSARWSFETTNIGPACNVITCTKLPNLKIGVPPARTKQNKR